MDIVVVPDPNMPTCGIVHWSTRSAPCALGRSGVVPEETKREGDGATPLGAFALRRVLWRSDRVAPPSTKLPSDTIAENAGWCDDPKRPEYNRPVSLPFAGSAEHLWRDDHLYDLVVILGHNDDPPVPFKGSAIFLHVAKPDFAPTEGCVAMAEETLRQLLSDVRPGDRLMVCRPEKT